MVVVEDVIGGAGEVVVCSVVVVRVTCSSLPQPATRTVTATKATTVMSRKEGIVLIMVWIQCQKCFLVGLS